MIFERFLSNENFLSSKFILSNLKTLLSIQQINKKEILLPPIPPTTNERKF